MQRRILAICAVITLLAVPVVLAGCGRSEQQDAQALIKNRWMVTKLVDASGRLVSPIEVTSAPAAAPSIAFITAEKTSGYTSLNNFGGQYEANDRGQLTFGTIATTKMTGNTLLMDQQDAFLRDLGEVRAFRIENHGLTLLDGEGKIVMRARPEVQLPLNETIWTCTGYDDGNGGYAAVLERAPISATFSGSSVTGSAGINAYVGSFDVDDEHMSIDSIIMTSDSPGSREAMAQEAAYLSALSAVTRYEIAGDDLTMYGAQKQRVATFVGQQP